MKPAMKPSMKTVEPGHDTGTPPAGRLRWLLCLVLCALLAISSASFAAETATDERRLDEPRSADLEGYRSEPQKVGDTATSASETATQSAIEEGKDAPETRRRAPPGRGSLMGQGPSSLPLPDYRTPSAAAPSGAAIAEDYEPEELLLVSNSMSEAIEAARDLGTLQFRIKHRQALEQLGMVLSVFRLPPNSDARRQLQTATQRLPHLQLELNHRYGLLAYSRQQMAQGMIQFPLNGTGCLTDARVGLLDTAVNLQHPALAGRRIELMQLAPPPLASSNHGTAIASLWLGHPDTGFLPLMPDASVSVAAVFRQGDTRSDTTTDLLLAGLDWLLGREVEAINLGLGGPHNRLLTLALEKILARDVLLVAAAGNQGPAAFPTYPAAQPGVIAATAVDANRHLYQNANRGAYIDFAAPGVQVWAASESGTAYHTGTSFASPFVLAALLAEKRLDQDWWQNSRESAQDLGPNGKDDSYGWGLVRWPAGCG